MAWRRTHLAFLVPIAILVYIQSFWIFTLTRHNSWGVEVYDYGPSIQPNLMNLYQKRESRIHTPRRTARLTHVQKDPFPVTDVSQSQPSTKLESCMDLRVHERGHWLHHSRTSNEISTTLSDGSSRHQYFPNEINWIKGMDLPSTFKPKSCTGQGEIFLSRLGNKCGCGTRHFEPTHSSWVYPMKEEESITSRHTSNAGPFTNSILRLVHRLINTDATLCFAGDSIDLQLYDSIHMQLRRFESLQKLHLNQTCGMSVETREIPVNYRTKCGKMYEGHRPCGFKSMVNIKETLIFERKGSDNERIGRIRYFKFYGWSPWNVEFMETCNIIIMNLGLHYSARGENFGLNYQPLIGDVFAALTYLTNFTHAKKDRVAIWRSALPQHFDTEDGHYDEEYREKFQSSTCLDLKDHSSRQVYNKVYDDAFSSLCTKKGHENDEHYAACNHLWHSCTVNLASVDYYTVYMYWKTHNFTNELKSLESRTDKSSVTGEILRWNIYDLFDVSMWHSDNYDCTHFCFIPSMFEAAFHRLDLLLSAFASI